MTLLDLFTILATQIPRAKTTPELRQFKTRGGEWLFPGLLYKPDIDKVPEQHPWRLCLHFSCLILQDHQQQAVGHLPRGPRDSFIYPNLRGTLGQPSCWAESRSPGLDNWFSFLRNWIDFILSSFIYPDDKLGSKVLPKMKTAREISLNSSI